MEAVLKIALYRILFTLPVGFFAICLITFFYPNLDIKISTLATKLLLLDNKSQITSLGVLIYIVILLVVGEAISSLGELLLSSLFFRFEFDSVFGFRERKFPIYYRNMNTKISLLKLKNMYREEKEKHSAEISEIHYSLSKLWAGIFVVLLILLVSLFSESLYPFCDYISKKITTIDFSILSKILIRHCNILLFVLPAVLMFATILFADPIIFLVLVLLLASILLFCYHRTIANIYL